MVDVFDTLILMNATIQKMFINKYHWLSTHNNNFFSSQL